MNKQQLIKVILDNSKIHHNIYVNHYKVQKAIESAKLTDDERNNFNQDMWIEGDMIENFKRNFEDLSENLLNDNGNRNLGAERDAEGRGTFSLKGKIWQYGRMGATLYWDAYWNGNNSGFGFIYDENDLNEKEVYELKEILRDIQGYNAMIDELMVNYYAELEYQAKEYKKQCRNERKQQKYDELIAPYNVNLFELSKSSEESIKRISLSLIKLLKIK